ncbi:MAG: serine/threonine-protein kinase [Ignavibacteriales bacterium]|nr:serine/threonine-protein kinase [Ignavibacteriales bacterium]
MIGTTVSHYKILEKLGEGGMGVVYKAHDTKLDRDVALKFLPHHLTATADEQARFLQEARAASALNHPNICGIYSIGEDGDRHFIEMEYVEGKTLRQMVPIQKTQIAVDYAIQIGEALQEAHSKGIVHRDVKADNIMVNLKNQIKVMDFGLAKLKGSLKLTKTSSTVGTLAYMAPEQIQGGEVDARSDIFSFGVVLYEMLAGHLPFRGEHEAAMMYSIVNEDSEPIQKYLPDVSSDLIHVLNRLLEKNPQDRYQSIAEAVIELKRLKRDTSKVHRIQPITQSVNPQLTTVSGASSQQLPIPSRPFWRKPLFLGSAIVLVVGIIAVGVLVFYPNAKEIVLFNPKGVVVAEFENQTGDGSLVHLSRMVTDALSQGLAQIGLVDVVPSSDALLATRKLQREPGSAQRIVPARDLGKATKAKLVVSGAFYRQGDNLQIRAEILDAETGKLLAAVDPVTKPSSAITDLIEELKERVLGLVALKHTSYLSMYLGILHPPTYKALKEFTQGYDFFTRSDYRSAIPCFQRAERIDSLFFAARIYLSVAHSNIGQLAVSDSIATCLDRFRDRFTDYERNLLDWIQSANRGSYEAAYRAAVKMRALVPSSTSTYISASYAARLNRPQQTINLLNQIDQQSEMPTKWKYYWGVLTAAYHILGQYDEELKVAQSARSLFPNDIVTLGYEFRALAALGKIQDVAQRLDECLSIPARPNADRGAAMRTAARELRAHGFTEASRDVLEKALTWYRTRTPDQLKTLRYGLGQTLYLASQFAEAQKTFEELVKESPDNIDYHGYLGVLAARRGDRAEAIKASSWLENQNRPYLYGAPLVWRASIAAVSSDQERAVMLLREAFAQGAEYGIEWHRDPDLESLRDYGPYKELMKVKE